jgi:hypothetical protein
MVFDERTSLIAIQTRHHDIDKNNVRLVIDHFAQTVKTIFCQYDFTACLRQENFPATTYGVAVVDKHYPDSFQTFAHDAAFPCLILARFRSKLPYSRDATAFILERSMFPRLSAP